MKSKILRILGFLLCLLVIIFMYFLINGSVSSWLSQLSSFWKIIYGFDIFAGIFFAGNIGVVLACDGGFFPDDRPTKRPL